MAVSTREQKPGRSSRARSAAWGLMTLTATLIATYAFGYFVFGAEMAPRIVRASRLAVPLIFLSHVGAAALALLIGPWQFVPRIRAKHRMLHRRLGLTYCLACFVGGTAGLLLALRASTGPISGTGFGTLAVVWIATTGMALVYARRRDFAGHRAWMIRSYALTLAGVTLRLYLPLPFLLGADFVASYRLIAWLCWVPNLLIAILFTRSDRRPADRTAVHR